MTNYILGVFTLAVIMAFLFWIGGKVESRRTDKRIKTIARKLLLARTKLFQVTSQKNMNEAIRVANQGLEDSE